MSFNSVTFLFFFLPVTLLVYYLIPKRFRNLVLVVASLFFYAWGEPVYLLLLILSVVLNDLFGRMIGRRAAEQRAARNMLILSIVVNLGMLAVFKYAGSFLLGSLFRFESRDMSMVFPIGLSFYTLQALSYLIDVYRGKVAVQDNFVDLALYITLFPKLLAGPVVCYKDFEGQLHGREFSWDQFGRGVTLFLFGLAKKAVLADGIGAAFDAINGQVSAGSAVPGVAWVGAASYMLQIYFDFSGYSDMAIGLALMFGFRFRKNFNRPYTAQSITDFWHRWHISLGSWFREYVYIPLGANQISVSRHILNQLIVMLLIGLWHGVSWTFLIWGLYYGALIILETYVWGKGLARLPGFVRHLYSLVLVLIGWVFFFSGSLRDAVHYLGTMFGAVDFQGSIRGMFYFLSSNWLLLLAGVLFSTALPMRALDALGFRGKRKAVYIGVLLALFALSLACLITENGSSFLYFSF